MSQPDILEQLMQSPHAVKIMEAAQSVLDKEKSERQRFYDLTHENFKAEFINGEIVLHSPARMRHWDVSMKLSSLLHIYVVTNKLGKVGVEKVMIRLTRNDYEPDICFFAKDRADTFTPDQALFPAPDFVVEILSESTEKIDRGIKFIDYAAHGVTEYWIIDPVKNTIEKYTLQAGEYLLEAKLATEGRLHSGIVPGFVVDLSELFTAP
jgi:Uma2 family endonuclease